MVHTAQLRFSTEGDGDVVDLTEGLLSVVRSAGVEDGLVSVFVPGSTAAVTTMEHEPGGVHDLRAALDRLVPRVGDYEPGGRRPPTSGLRPEHPPHTHAMAAIVGPSETLPLREGNLGTGTWQQVVMVDFDDRPRQRTVVVQIVT